MSRRRPWMAAWLMLGLSSGAAPAPLQVVSLWPQGAPGAQHPAIAETSRVTEKGERVVSNVHSPSIAVHLPAASLGVSRSTGVTGVVGSIYTVEGSALADVQRALRWVRSHSAEWHVAPDRIGVMGFSAGGELAALAATRYDAGDEKAADPIDRLSSRPAFEALIYPAIPHDMQLSKETPPAFLLAGADDAPAISQGMAALYLSLRQAGVPAFVAVGAITNPGGFAWAQAAPGIHQDNSGMNGSISHEELERMSGDQTQASKSTKEVAAAKAAAMAQSTPLIKALKISCDINDARLVISGTRQAGSGGKKVDTRVYEAACSGAVGYLLEVQGTEAPMAVSCVAAEEARAADVAQGKEPGFFCKLPENQDVYALVGSLIRTDAHADCAVDVLQSLGRSETTQSSYSEIKCKDNQGYMLRLPLPGSTSKATAMSCADAAKQGVKCRLTETAADAATTSGDEPVTLATLKNALLQNGVGCNVAQLRLIGQEDHLKRYVVEYLCAAQSTGTVAFIPLTGNAHPYESMDCDKALLNRIPCNLVPGK